LLSWQRKTPSRTARKIPAKDKRRRPYHIPKRPPCVLSVLKVYPVSYPPILMLGYSEAAMLMRQPLGAQVQAIISIHGLHEYAVEAPGLSQRLTLRFDDVDVPDPNDPIGMYRSWVQRKWAAEIGRPVTAPSREDAGAIIDFARSIRDMQGTLLCQCQAGISRSPAAALLCLAAWIGAGRERDCVEQIKRIRPASAPHMGLIAFGDALLRRQGELVKAVLDQRRV
jgi:predicted protein tyrosine phosphatase